MKMNESLFLLTNASRHYPHIREKLTQIKVQVLSNMLDHNPPCSTPNFVFTIDSTLRDGFMVIVALIDNNREERAYIFSNSDFIKYEGFNTTV